jgi:hypothetical protein
MAIETNLSGKDLNRRWQSGRRHKHRHWHRSQPEFWLGVDHQASRLSRNEEGASVRRVETSATRNPAAPRDIQRMWRETALSSESTSSSEFFRKLGLFLGILGLIAFLLIVSFCRDYIYNSSGPPRIVGPKPSLPPYVE